MEAAEKMIINYLSSLHDEVVATGEEIGTQLQVTEVDQIDLYYEELHKQLQNKEKG